MADNILSKILRPGVRGRMWQVFLGIILLSLFAGVINFGQYYNKGAEWLANNTGGAIKLPAKEETPFRLGLDLLGGTHLVYRADLSQVPDEDKSSALSGVRDVIERRVNVFGVSEPIVQTSESGGEPRIIVELAGIKDVNEAIKMIGETPLLEFKENSGEARQLTADEQAQLDEINRQAEAKAEEALGKLLSGGDFAALAREYSQDAATKESGGDLGYVTQDSRPDLVALVQGLNVGEYTRELEQTAQGYEILRLDDKRAKANPFSDNEPEKEVKAAHILICYEGSERCESGLSKDEAYAKIKQLKERATPANFAQLARENSTEPGAAQSGGDLGWFGRGAMVKPFEDAVFGQAKGSVSFVVETMFGYHIIYKEDERFLEEYKISHIFIPTLSEEQAIGEDVQWKNTELTGKQLDRASVSFNPNDGTPEVSLQFDDEGSKMFEEITTRNVGQPVAIFLDGSIISAPRVNEAITGGQAVISGSFNIQEAKELAQRLNAGALPVPIELISQATVGASLGQASLAASLKAGIFGLLFIAVFMIFYYRLPGLLSVFSLVIYGLLVLMVFKLWPVTLSLAGIAGFILSIGMAVDANVLIFERLKEELGLGKPLSLAVSEAFDRAWLSIRDGNISTLITCLILIQFSTSVIKGFAITLSIGILISMFTAIWVTRNFLNLAAGRWLVKAPWLLRAKKITQ